MKTLFLFLFILIQAVLSNQVSAQRQIRIGGGIDLTTNFFFDTKKSGHDYSSYEWHSPFKLGGNLSADWYDSETIAQALSRVSLDYSVVEQTLFQTSGGKFGSSSYRGQFKTHSIGLHLDVLSFCLKKHWMLAGGIGYRTILQQSFSGKHTNSYLDFSTAPFYSWVSSENNLNDQGSNYLNYTIISTHLSVYKEFILQNNWVIQCSFRSSYSPRMFKNMKYGGKLFRNDLSVGIMKSI